MLPEKLIAKHTVKNIIVYSFLFGFIAFASVHGVYGQTQIHGTVRDANGKPFNNANVVLINAIDSSEVASDIASEGGTWAFNNLSIGDYTVRVTAIGYDEKYSPMFGIVSAQDNIDVGVIILQVKGQELNEVVVRRKPLFEQKIGTMSLMSGNIPRHRCKPSK